MAGIVTKRVLARRTFLRGAGAAIALPWLDAMAPALAAAPAAGPTRLGFFYVPNGMAMEAWRGASAGACPVLGGLLAPLAPLRDRVTVVSGLSQPCAQRVDDVGPHPRAAAAWLSGMPLVTTEAGRLRGAVTADQIAARDIGRETAVPSLELIADVPEDPLTRPGTPEAARRTISWQGPDVPNPMAWEPRAVLARLFGTGDDDARPDGSILDGVVAQLHALERRLGARDRAAIDDYLTAIRQVEKAPAPAPPPAALRSEAPAGEARFTDAADADPAALTGQLLDLLYLAYRADLTRVATFMFGSEASSRVYATDDGMVAHHEISHHGGDPASLAALAAINRIHVGLFARFCERLRDTPDGDATLLDRAVFLYGAGLSDSSRHRALDLPLLVVGGANGSLDGNRHLQYDAGAPEPMANLLLGLLVKAGVRAGRLGDSTGVLPGI
jgi:hypothetical protein